MRSGEMTVATRRAFAGAMAASIALAACGGGSTNHPDGGDGSTTGFACTQIGRSFCHNGGYYNCDATGHATLSQSCDVAAPVCVEGVGCRPCMSGTTRCDPTNVNRPQICRPDSSGYDNQTACRADLGQSCTNGACMTPCQQAAASHSYLGCEYWPVTLKNTCMGELGGTFPFAIAIANPQTTDVTATITGGALSATMTQTIAHGALQIVQLPWVDDLAQLRVRPGTSVIHPGGAYHVVTNAPVTVYQFNPLTFESMGNFSYSNDASLLLPTGVLGSQYTLLTWPGVTFRIGMTPPWESGGTLTVVATAAATHVDVTLAGTTFAGPMVTAGTVGAVQGYDLAAGDVLQLIGHGEGTDLTGSTVHSSAPVAVFAGHGCAQVPVDRAAGNHLEEQSFPDSAWGRHYAVSAMIDRPMIASVVRIIAQQDNTNLVFDPPSVHPANTPIAARHFIEFQTAADFSVTADRPILVAQFLLGGGLESGVSDPAMVYEVPVEQYRTQYTFLAPDSFTHSYVNIVGHANAPPMLDGAALTATPRALGASGLSVWSTEIQPGVHSAQGIASDSGFAIKVYGSAAYTAYAYPGGLDLQVIVPQ